MNFNYARQSNGTLSPLLSAPRGSPNPAEFLGGGGGELGSALLTVYTLKTKKNLCRCKRHNGLCGVLRFSLFLFFKTTKILDICKYLLIAVYRLPVEFSFWLKNFFK